MVGQLGTLLPALYQIESAHWWSVGMRQVTHALLKGIHVPPGPTFGDRVWWWYPAS